MSELVRIVNKLHGVESGVIAEEDVVRSIKTLQSLSAGYEVIDVSGGAGRPGGWSRNWTKTRRVVLVKAQLGGGQVGGDVGESAWVDIRAGEGERLWYMYRLARGTEPGSFAYRRGELNWTRTGSR
ncbi:hypothetical protein L210DRAFT_231151 [Boletus edulis BED1]|uniref:Uncharacterized protein n=1 Tax=Boletus edulis BED1 TaxID=1328754 RepID=A0AAD4G879_BOLED|nr:hypothetical protein L210DRAFT_231151 [Boletus edulis BED1]